MAIRDSRALNSSTRPGRSSGIANRYNGGSTNLGTSAWLYDGATTLNIGLTGSEYTRNDGYQRSDAEQLNEAGQVSGYSERYNGDRHEIGAGRLGV